MEAGKGESTVQLLLEAGLDSGELLSARTSKLVKLYHCFIYLATLSSREVTINSNNSGDFSFCQPTPHLPKETT